MLSTDSNVDIWNIVIRNGKGSLEARALLLIFLLELEISGVAVHTVQQKNKIGGFCEELFSENDFVAV